MILEAKEITKTFGSLEVLKGIDLQVKESEILSIVGASGAGKSTLLHILGTLDRPDRGTILYQGKDITRLKDKELSEFRNKNIGFVFQFHHLLPEFTALENICIPAFIAGQSRRKAESRALELMELLNLTARKSHKPSALSGGEQQRVAVARALINSPGIVFADEPTGNLDSTHSEELHKLFLHLRDELGQTFIVVTHNQSLAGLSDRKMTISDGLLEK
jgi:lipoprotein-releasing system ATP-binding protein